MVEWWRWWIGGDGGLVERVKLGRWWSGEDDGVGEMVECGDARDGGVVEILEWGRWWSGGTESKWRVTWVVVEVAEWLRG